MAEKEGAVILEEFWGRAQELHYYVSIPFNISGNDPQPIQEFIEHGLIISQDFNPTKVSFNPFELSNDIDFPTELNFEGVDESSPRITLCLISGHVEGATPSVNRGQRSQNVWVVEPNRLADRTSPVRQSSYTAMNKQNQTECITLSSVRAIVVGDEDAQRMIGQQVTEMLLNRQIPKSSRDIEKPDRELNGPQTETYVVSRKDWNKYTLEIGHRDLLTEKSRRVELGLGALNTLDTVAFQEGLDAIKNAVFYKDEWKVVGRDLIEEFFELGASKQVSAEVVEMEQHLLAAIGDLPNRATFVHEVAAITATRQRIDSSEFCIEYGSLLKAASMQFSVIRYALIKGYHFKGGKEKAMAVMGHLAKEVEASTEYVNSKKRELDIIIDREALQVDPARNNWWVIANEKYDELFVNIVPGRTVIQKSSMIRQIVAIFDALLDYKKLLISQLPKPVAYVGIVVVPPEPDVIGVPLTFRGIAADMMENLSDITVNFMLSCLLVVDNRRKAELQS